MTDDAKLRVSVIGASGYTGAELLRLLEAHPGVAIARIVGNAKAGQTVRAALPSSGSLAENVIDAFDAPAVAEASDVAFCALPHGASAPIVEALALRGVVVFDLSADFRLRDPVAHHTWYGERHAPDIAARARYGLVELHRDALRDAAVVAVPGCYPTASILALAPLLRSRLVETTGIVIDAKSGVSGAGRSPTAGTHFSETSEGMRAYKIAGQHRHTPEIEQELSLVARSEIRVLFTPHLAPMTRGILATAYAMTLDPEGDVAQRCTDAARVLYRGSPSVDVLEPGACPDTLWVRGCNRAIVSYTFDPRTGRVIAQCAIDNLVKGAAGQAIQAMNVRFGFDEATALPKNAIWP